MSNRLNQFLAGEAADYLQELDELLTSSGEPDRGRLLQLATGVRGSTQLAGADSIARLASRVEEAARSIVTSHSEWTEQVRAAMRGTVADVRSLVGELGQWGAEQEQQVRRSIDRWDEALGRRYSDSRPAVPIDSLFYDDDGPHIVAAAEPAPPELPVMSIEQLLLRGESAIREALALRSSFDALARGDAVSERTPAALVEELFDLLHLGLSPEVTEV